MRYFLLSKLYKAVSSLVLRQDGQGLMEYALIAGLIAFAAAAGLNSVAVGIQTEFSNVGSFLSSSVS